ncbi:MAG: S8 family serine peptidase [Schleiferiaceae bacterium]|nr:S8 family serine peptidase [Schleiferiaceae bacterium]
MKRKLHNFKSAFLWLLIFNVTITIGYAQNNQLPALQEQLEREQVEKNARVNAYLAQTGLERRIESEDNRTISELVDVIDGAPYYYTTFNREGGELIKADRVYPSGGAGLNLTGSGQLLGIWDGGGTRTTHQEFTSRVIQQDIPTGLSNHATHVAGTMMAAGIANLTAGTTNYPQGAKGMSYGANLWAYDWNSDNAEMSSAASNGLQASQHSYGFITGWALGDWSGTSAWHWFGRADISSTEDYSFGFYDSKSRSWDLIANAHDEYLIVKSAGNDRGEGPTPGTGHYFLDPNNSFSWTLSTATRDLDGGSNGYDCITDAGNAKNVLTVGAITAAGAMSSFSGWGPTDDGRVKPDLVAKGVDVLSTGANSNTHYYFSNGTSMSGPMISGAMGLLMEHQHHLHPGKKLKAATLKALAIHTADDRVGGSAEGPDYRFGWGLMDVEKATAVMSANSMESIHIFEEQLQQGEEWIIPINATGTEPLRVTLVWNDPAATVSSLSLNNRTPKLVNDLDVRILHTSGTTAPYILDPDNPASPATRGDNFRDNVEMVHIATPTSGNYLVRISHKGTLTNGQQAFSLIISGNEEVTTVADYSLIPATATLVIAGTVTLSDDLIVSGLNIPNDGQLAISPNSHLTIVDALEIAAAGSLVLKSDASGYSQFKIDKNASVSALGAITQEQWVSGNGWRNIGIPLVGQIAGDMGAVEDTGPESNLFTWNASTSTWEVVSPSTPLERGVGYSAFVGNFGVIDNNEKFIAAGSPTTTHIPVLDYHDGTGSTNTFADPALAAGWNFLANPFTAGLDFEAIPQSQFTNTNRSYYIWNPSKGTSGGYDAWSAAASPNDLSSVIPPLQGFWVQTTGTGASLGELTTDFTTISSSPTFTKTSAIRDFIEIRLSENETLLDHLTLALQPHSTMGYDREWDAVKLVDHHTGPTLFSLSGDLPMAINAIPFDFDNRQPVLIPIGVSALKGRPLQFVYNPEHLSFQPQVYIWNKSDNQLHQLSKSHYELPEDAENKTLFVVLANKPVHLDAIRKNVLIHQNQDAIVISSAAYFGEARVAVMDLSGKDVIRSTVQFDDAGTRSIALSTKTLAKGVYIVHITLAAGEVVVQKIIK